MGEDDPYPLLDYSAFGLTPPPQKPPYPDWFGPYDPVPPPDPKYEEQLADWKANFTPAQQKAYQAHCAEVKGWFKRRNEERKAIEQNNYEKLGLELGVNTPDEYHAARNMKFLQETIGRIQLAIEAEEANKQFEALFNK